MERATIDGLDVRVFRGGEGPPLLYLHSGLGEAGRTRMVDRVGQRFSVLAPEIPGFGASEAPSWHRVEDAVFFLRCLLDHYDWPPTHAAGASLGGWLAAEMAVWFPQRIRSLVLFDPVGIRVEGAPLTDIFIGGRETMIASMFVTAPDDYAAMLGDALGGAIGGDGDASDAMVHSYSAMEATARIAWNPQFCDPRLRDRLSRCTTPATVVWGDGDAVVPRAYAEAYAAAFPSAEFVVLDGVGHLPVLEAPERAAQVVVDALAGVRA